MNAYANVDLMMPAHYVDMSEKEMEYDGLGNGAARRIQLKKAKPIIASQTEEQKKEATKTAVTYTLALVGTVCSAGTIPTVGGIFGTILGVGSLFTTWW